MFIKKKKNEGDCKSAFSLRSKKTTKFIKDKAENSSMMVQNFTIIPTLLIDFIISCSVIVVGRPKTVANGSGL